MTALAVYAASIALMAGIGRLIRAVVAVTRGDLELMNLEECTRAGVTNEVARIIDLLGGRFSWAVVIAVVLAAWAVGRHRWPAVRIALLVLLPWFANTAVKVLVARPRPPLAHHPEVPAAAPGGPIPMLNAGPLVDLPSSCSFPSGHTAFATALCGAIVLTLPRASRARRVALVLSVPLVLLVAWSRVHLGVHHPSDVIAAMLLVPGLSWVTARAVPEHPGRRDPRELAAPGSTAVPVSAPVSAPAPVAPGGSHRLP